MMKRGPRGSDRPPNQSEIAAPSQGTGLTLGAHAARRWLVALGLPALPRWNVEIEISAGPATRFELHIYPEEWGFVFHHMGLASWIRVTDIPFVHGRDDYRLLGRTPDLLAVMLVLGELEAEHRLNALRARATIRTSIPDAADIVRAWLVQTPPHVALRKTIEL